MLPAIFISLKNTKSSKNNNKYFSKKKLDWIVSWLLQREKKILIIFHSAIKMEKISSIPFKLKK